MILLRLFYQVDLESNSILKNLAKIKEIFQVSEEKVKEQIKELIIQKRMQNTPSFPNYSEGLQLNEGLISSKNLQVLTDKIYQISIDLQLDSKLIDKASNILDIEAQIAGLKNSSGHEELEKYLILKKESAIT